MNDSRIDKALPIKADAASKLLASLEEIKHLLSGDYSLVRRDGEETSWVDIILIGDIFERADKAMDIARAQGATND